MLSQIFQQALPGLEALLAAVLSYLAILASKWINEHAKNAQVNAILQRLLATSQVVVQEVEQTIVNQMSGGAPLNTAQAKAALDAALDKLKEHLGPKGIAELEAIIQPGQLNQILISYIEAAVHKVNQSAPANSPVAVLATTATATTAPKDEEVTVQP